jgi:hypothetical protein
VILGGRSADLDPFALGSLLGEQRCPDDNNAKLLLTGPSLADGSVAESATACWESDRNQDMARKRVLYWFRLIRRSVWPIFAIPFAILVNVFSIRDEFLPPDLVAKLKMPEWLPTFPWYYWTIIVLALIILALLEGAYREHTDFTISAAKRPELDIQFDPENIPECQLGTPPVIQYRIKVSNFRSGKTVRNCQGRVAFVERLSAPNKMSLYSEKVPLTWSYLKDLDKLDLHDGETYPLNVIQVGLVEIGGQPVARFITTQNANNAPHPFDLVGDYRCVVAVTSEDTTPKYVDFIFGWTGDPSTARIRSPAFSDKSPQPTSK